MPGSKSVSTPFTLALGIDQTSLHGPAPGARLVEHLARRFKRVSRPVER